MKTATQFGCNFKITAKVDGVVCYGVPCHIDGKVKFVWRDYELLRPSGRRAVKGDPIKRYEGTSFNLEAVLSAYKSICERADEVYPEISELSIVCMDGEG